MYALRTLAFVAAALVAPLSHALDLTDLWWSPAEPGWGMNVVQQDETAVVTLHVYDAAGIPTWYIGAADVYGFIGSNPQLRGTFYRMQGDYHAGPFEPARTRGTPAGPFWLSATGPHAAALEYHVENRVVRKTLERQTFRIKDVTTTHAATFRLRHTPPGGIPTGVLEYAGDLVVQVEGDAATLRVERPGEATCIYHGTRVQSGRYADIRGNFTCGAQDVGSFEATSLEFTEHGITGHLRVIGPQGTYAGRFAGVRY